MSNTLSNVNFVKRKHLQFSPNFLFKGGVEGVWFDPSDLGTMFQDSKGSTPAEFGSPVGLWLDMSRGLLQASPELLLNPDFSEGSSSWIMDSGGWSIVDGKAVKTLTGSESRMYQAVADAEGYYSLTVDVESINGSIQVMVGASTTGNAYASESISTPGVHRCILPKASSSNRIYLRGSANGEAVVNSVSAKYLPGLHAVQPTATARPILGKMPRGGRRNILDGYSEGNVASFKGQTSGVLDAVVPISGFDNSVEFPPFPSATIYCYTDMGKVYGGSGVATFSVFMEIEGGPPIQAFGPGGSGDFRAIAKNSDLGLVDEIEEYGPNIYRLKWNSKTIGTAPTNNFGIARNIAQSGRVFKISGFQFEDGPVVTPYQRVVNNYDITEQGVQTVNYLYFDGVDDELNIPTLTDVDISGGGSFGVSYLKNVISGTVYLFTLTGASSSNPTGLYVSSSNNWSRVRSEVFPFNTSGTLVPLTNTTTWDESTAFTRWNDEQFRTSIAIGPTGIGGNGNIGRRPGGSFFGGNLYNFVVTKKTLPENHQTLLHNFLRNRNTLE